MSKIKILALAILSVAMISFVDCKGNKADQASEDDTLSIPSGSDYEETTIVGDETPDDFSQTVGNTEAEDQVMIEDKEGRLTPEQNVTINENDVFYIIAGSFTVYNNAKNCNQKLKSQGYNSVILEPYGQYNRVTVQSFKTREEAKAALPALRNKVRNATLWILKR